jgi:hypothetical protein
MALSMEQLLLLNNLIYLDGIESNQTLGDNVESLLLSLPQDENLSENRAMLSAILRDETLPQMWVAKLVDDEFGMRVLCILDRPENPQDVTVIFRGTGNDEEWRDNGMTVYRSDTPAQERAAAYIMNLPPAYGDEVTVTGHSKGGNKAQYVTVTTKRIASCLSFDGPGFSKEFLEKYSQEIAANKHKITSVAATQDIVNALMYPIAGQMIYLENRPESSYLLYHKPYVVFSPDYRLLPETNQALLPKALHEYSITLMEQLPHDQLSYVADGLMEAVITLEGQVWPDPTTMLHILLAIAMSYDVFYQKREIQQAAVRRNIGVFDAAIEDLYRYAKRLEGVNNRLGHVGDRLHHLSLEVEDPEEMWEILALEEASGRYDQITRSVSYLFKVAKCLDSVQTKYLAKVTFHY